MIVKGLNMPRKPNPELVDDDSPELDDAWFKSAQPATELLPSLFGSDAAAAMLKPKRGRPLLDTPKQHVNIRLDADIVLAFKSRGSGWQTKVNSALREWLSADSF
jgi:uncharacterized protein (DUF4415 family)